MEIVHLCSYDNTNLEDCLNRLKQVVRINSVPEFDKYLLSSNKPFVLVSSKFVGVYNITTEVLEFEEVHSHKNLTKFVIYDSEYPKGKSSGFPRFIPKDEISEKFIGCFHDNDYDLMIEEIYKVFQV